MADQQSFLEGMRGRGLAAQVSEPSQKAWPTLEQRLAGSEPITGYIGFDPTAASLHVGSLLQILNLVRLQRAGHRAIALVGGGTGLIGDPSFKATERAMLGRDELERNVLGIRGQLERFLDFDGANAARLLNNLDWLGDLSLTDFLRDVGKHFSVNQMIQRDAVRLRLEGRAQGISFTEFSYALLQAYDFLVLSDGHGCELQMGGTDQWGNVLDGIDLIRRVRQRPAWGLVAPLVTKADGSKFGKTESGNVWLDPELTPPYVFYQFWLNCDDADAGDYLRYFTFVPPEEIRELEAEAAEQPQARPCQKRLAVEVTRLVHGEVAVESAQRATRVLFEGGDLGTLSAAELRAAFHDTPSTSLARDLLGTDAALLTTLVASSGLEKSRGQARKAIQSGAISINGQVVKAIDHVVAADQLLSERYLVLRRGKKTYHLLEFA